MVKVSVIKFEQGEIPMYVGKMKAKDILDTWKVDEFSEEHLDAYQRERYSGRTGEIANYLSNCPIPVIPPVLASLREGAKFDSANGDIGSLAIPKYNGAIFMVDGGHRTGGFETIQRRINEMKIGIRKLSADEVSELQDLLDFEVPVAFFDAKAAAERVNHVLSSERRENLLAELDKKELEPEDIERIFFFVINKTQKSIRPSLKDTLMYLIAAAGIKGIPIVEKEMWRAESTPLALELNFGTPEDPDTPLKGLINISGARGLGRPIQLASFVSSLEPLMKRNKRFRTELNQKGRFAFLKAYWNVIKSMHPEAFREDLRGNYVIMRAIGVYSLNKVANNVFNWCYDEGMKLPAEQDIEKWLEPLGEFPWARENSPIAAFGGMKGVQEAHKLLLAVLANGGNEKALQTLKDMKLDQSEINDYLGRAKLIPKS